MEIEEEDVHKLEDASRERERRRKVPCVWGGGIEDVIAGHKYDIYGAGLTIKKMRSGPIWRRGRLINVVTNLPALRLYRIFVF